MRKDLHVLAASFIEVLYLSEATRANGKPPTPRAAYRAWSIISCIHQRQGLPKLEPDSLGRNIEALVSEYQIKCGLDADPSRRHEPMRDAEHRHLMNLPEGCRIGPYLYQRDSRFGLSWRALLAVLDQSGFRQSGPAIG